MFVTLLLIVLSVYSTRADPQSYAVKMEETKVLSVDSHFIDTTMALVAINSSCNVLNMTHRYKFTPDETFLHQVTVNRLTKNGRTFTLYKMVKTFKEVVDMSAFDVNVIWLEYTRPALTWPIKPHVTYRTYGWVPTMSPKYPVQLPTGNLRIDYVYKFSNGTIITTAMWILSVLAK